MSVVPIDNLADLMRRDLGFDNCRLRLLDNHVIAVGDNRPLLMEEELVLLTSVLLQVNLILKIHFTIG